MATTELPATDVADRELHAALSEPAGDVVGGLRVALDFFASLRLTVVLFALMIFLVFAGTLAQKAHGIWYVVEEAYFRVWIARIELQAFEALAQIFYPAADWGSLGGLWFPFPGGFLIGSVMALNLLAAHYRRFRVAARGSRLWGGAAVILAGVAIAILIVRSGMDDALESELTPGFCNLLWHSLRAATAGLALAGAYGLILSYNRVRWTEWLLLAGIDALVAGLAVWLFVNPDVRLDDSGLRIVWQLSKCGLAAAVLLAGCGIVFAKRGGIVLLHGGVGLLMFSELWTGITANEANMTIFEGRSANYTYDTRRVELALVDRDADPDEDVVTVVPGAMLKSSAAHDGRVISHPDLPFDLAVSDYYVNSELRELGTGEENRADQGAGRFAVAKPVATISGVSMSQGVDTPSAYVELRSKDGESLGTYLVSTAGIDVSGGRGPAQTTYLPDQSVEVDGKTYDLSLQFKRDYKPYSLSLIDFSFDRYTATNTAKNFSSRVRLVDRENNVDSELLIWMNNPLRYGGETFYQSGWDEETERATILQVVSNPGWMVPYMAFTLVGFGMVSHFWNSLARFVRRRAERRAAASVRTRSEGDQAATAGPQYSQWAMVWFPLAMVVLWGGYVVGKARMPELPRQEMQIHEFGKLPVAYQGRIQPFDTVARNTLQILSGRQTVIVPKEQSGRDRTEKLPAIRWLLDAISQSPAADQHRVFRIDNLDVLAALDLEGRPGSYRYSINDLRPGLAELDEQVKLALREPPAKRSLFQRRILDAAEKLQKYTLLVRTFSSPQIRSDPEHLIRDLEQAKAKVQDLKEGIRDPQHPLKLVAAVPPTEPTGNWTFVLDAEFKLLQDQVMGREMNPATVSLATLLQAYAEGDTRTFNAQLPKYERILADYESSLKENPAEVRAAGLAPCEIYSRNKVSFETFFNQFSPFYYAAVLYLVAFVLAALAWLGWWAPLNRAANWLLIFTLVVHTFALGARIYISGRPPVTNLYSTAIFIGWGCVVLALVIEALYRLGIGNVVASLIGFLTLVIAYNLSLDGDTFLVLQAVLDTQFWLATHVISINLGYATTMLAGVFGVLYLLMHHVAGRLDTHTRQQLARMIYGTLCFAILFSFVGTVLGGLWADDSWGRFWGWDPKENGALMIVLWNALVLHARWGALVGPRGLANLTVAGTIVTAWSWFGVNELGVGLHAYGASETSTAMWLGGFALSQLAIIGVGLMPEEMFRRKREAGAPFA